MKRKISMLAVLVLGSIAVNAQQAIAQLTITPEQTLSLSITESAEQAGQLNRAKNLARQAAEKANGGLNYYRAEASMHGPAAEAPFVENGDGTITFTFMGGAPGYTAPTVKTVATVNLTTGDVQIDYNGSMNGFRETSERGM
jgi:hypothetical protein